VIEEIRPEENREPVRLSWPFEPRRSRKILPEEAGQIKVLLSHVRAGNMDIDSIAQAYGVSPDTIRRIQNKKTYAKVRPDRTLKRPERKRS
jgi:DNA invertase Pin-like site-specific DNA recombinase